MTTGVTDMPTAAQTTYYSLRVKRTGQLVRLYSQSNSGADFCNSTTVELSEHGPVLRVNSALAALKILVCPQEWYNSDESHPMLGRFTKDDLAIVKVTETVAVDLVPMESVIEVSCKYVADVKPYNKKHPKLKMVLDISDENWQQLNGYHGYLSTGHDLWRAISIPDITKHEIIVQRIEIYGSVE